MRGEKQFTSEVDGGGEANVKGCGRWELARRPLGLLSFSSSISLSLTSAPDFAL